MPDGEFHRGQATERHPDDHRRPWSMGLDDHRDVVGEVLGRVGTIGSPIGMPVSREIDGEERTIERERHRVPGVCVLGPAVNAHDLHVVVAPAKCAHRATGIVRNRRLDPPYDRVL